ncbi:DUF4270 domain-containing protein [Aestuariivivens sp. NBU2969]|uniref:DUF4270 domain-containing protein n=1 Tax=Aestuariivivens sp. NBU2969 TaxID=2873267 RepID=UPI001CBC6864|nr:DUF4270 domain-containing protein [Aestuariivivens sp. NBU2969]
MEKTYKALNPLFILVFIITSFIACDKDFSSIDSDVLGKDNANFNTNKINIGALLAYNKKLKNVQVNGLNANLLGVYNDPVYGQTTASIVSQITPTFYNPDFGDNPVIDSVILNIPYFSRENGVDDDGNTKYVINEQDSLYGNDKIILSIYRNNYFLRDFNPNTQNQETQSYFSFAENTSNNTENFIVTENSEVNFDSYKDQLIAVDSAFIPSSNPIVTLTGEGEEASLSYAAPALRIDLYNPDNTFWEDHIFAKQDGSELSNVNNFKNYFRGLYIKAEPKEDLGSMTLLNLGSSNATITIYYSKDPISDGDPRIQATYAFNFNGIKLNTLINDFSIAPALLADGNNSEGDQTLYLKGAAGSMAVIDLFGNDYTYDPNQDVPDALIDLRNEFRDDGNPTRLINEAHLVILEDQALTVGDDHTYDRLYVYDVKNNIPLIDYSFDPSENTVSPVSSKIVHLGKRDTLSTSPLIIGYKIRITEHIKNLVFKDSTNTKLGLTISNNVNYTSNAKILNTTDDVSNIPAATLLTSRGTVLYGSNTVDDKKIKLEIYFSEPE